MFNPIEGNEVILKLILNFFPVRFFFLRDQNLSLKEKELEIQLFCSVSWLSNYAKVGSENRGFSCFIEQGRVHASSPNVVS